MVESGLFQGCGYYRPDYGSESLIAVFSGRIVLFTIIAGSSWTAVEITPPNDSLDPNAHQVWMWQSEKWMIISDGTGSLPVFFDGISCRRSYGPSRILGTTSASVTPPNPRVIGEVISVSLTENFTGDFNTPVIFNKASYQAIANSSPNYDVSIKNINGTPGGIIPAGSDVIISPGTSGIVTSKADIYVIGSPGYAFVEISVNSTQGINVGDTIEIDSMVITCSPVIFV